MLSAITGYHSRISLPPHTQPLLADTGKLEYLSLNGWMEELRSLLLTFFVCWFR